MASGYIFTDDDTVEPGASAMEQILELRLLTAEDKGIGPVDMARKDPRPE